MNFLLCALKRCKRNHFFKEIYIDSNVYAFMLCNFNGIGIIHLNKIYMNKSKKIVAVFLPLE